MSLPNVSGRRVRRVPLGARAGGIIMRRRSPSPDPVRPFLMKNSFLGRLPAVVIVALLEKGEIRRLAKGAIAYERGDPGHSLMVVIKGRINFSIKTWNAIEVILNSAGVAVVLGGFGALM